MSTATVALKGYTFEPACAAPLCASKRSKLAEARLGNGEAFAEMMQPYSLGLYRRALRMTGNPADAEDARQEAMLKAYSRLNQFAGQQDDSKDDLHAWVSRITTNASIDLIRQRREGKYVSLEEPGASPEETFGARLAACIENPEERYARREMRSLLAASIARLAPELRQICLLRDVLQYSTTEVAARLGISAVAVRLRLFRAHRRLRDILRDRLAQKRRPTFAACERHAANIKAANSGGRLFAVRPQAGFACGD